METASDLITQTIAALADWRGETLGRMRQLIREAVPEIAEEVKWRGTPVWSHAGIICTGESYKTVVKLTFAKGAFLKDPAGLFNASLDGNMRRAIDIHEGEERRHRLPGVDPRSGGPQRGKAREEDEITRAPCNTIL